MEKHSPALAYRAQGEKSPMMHVAAHSPEPTDIPIPRGWKYKSWRIGPIRVPWYGSPESQLILVSFVCFLCPGMFNAINGMGAGGQLDTYASDTSNSAVYATFAIVGFFAGTVVNALGIRIALSFGGLGYCIYIGSFLCYKYTENFGFVVFSGCLLGCCAGILWSAQGAIMMSYPLEKSKGRFISSFWVIFNMGAVIGSLVALGLNVNNRGDQNGDNRVSDGTYISLIVLSFLGACLSWTLVDAKHIVRRDGSKVILMKNPTWKTEIFGLWETLWNDPYVVLLFPMFFASNWFYTYQFQDVNYARFDVRTRALNNVLYWLAQMFGALVFGFALDLPYVRRTTRAKAAWVVMFALTFGIWGGGYVFQKDYTREDTPAPYDWDSNGYVGPMFLYILYGFYDAAWQTCVYWFMGAITNNSRKLANFAGFYKGIQSAGAAIIWRLDGLKHPYMGLFGSCWALLAGGLVIALPVMLWKIKDTVPVEEDLKFTDETLEDVIGTRMEPYSDKRDRV